MAPSPLARSRNVNEYFAGFANEALYRADGQLNKQTIVADRRGVSWPVADARVS
jgi:hypothetical protein